MDLYLKKVFSTRACWWYPDSFFHLATPDLPYSSDSAIPSARSPRSRRRSSSLLKIFDYVLLSPIDPVRLTGFLKHDCQPKSQGIEQCFEATELGVPILGKHPVQVLTV